MKKSTHFTIAGTIALTCLVANPVVAATVSPQPVAVATGESLPDAPTVREVIFLGPTGQEIGRTTTTASAGRWTNVKLVAGPTTEPGEMSLPAGYWYGGLRLPGEPVCTATKNVAYVLLNDGDPASRPFELTNRANFHLIDATTRALVSHQSYFGPANTQVVPILPPGYRWADPALAAKGLLLTGNQLNYHGNLLVLSVIPLVDSGSGSGTASGEHEPAFPNPGDPATGSQAPESGSGYPDGNSESSSAPNSSATSSADGEGKSDHAGSDNPTSDSQTPGDKDAESDSSATKPGSGNSGGGSDEATQPGNSEGNAASDAAQPTAPSSEDSAGSSQAPGSEDSATGSAEATRPGDDNNSSTSEGDQSASPNPGGPAGDSQAPGNELSNTDGAKENPPAPSDSDPGKGSGSGRPGSGAGGNEQGTQASGSTTDDAKGAEGDDSGKGPSSNSPESDPGAGKQDSAPTSGDQQPGAEGKVVSPDDTNQTTDSGTVRGENNGREDGSANQLDDSQLPVPSPGQSTSESNPGIGSSDTRPMDQNPGRTTGPEGTNAPELRPLADRENEGLPVDLATTDQLVDGLMAAADPKETKTPANTNLPQTGETGEPSLGSLGWLGILGLMFIARRREN